MLALRWAIALLFVCLPLVSQGADGERAPLILESFIDGSGPPIAMLGGGTRGADEFMPHASILAKNYRVVRLQTLNISRAQRQQPLPADYSIALDRKRLARHSIA